MSTHWIHVTASWALVLGGFGAIAIAALLRHRSATTTLKRLDPRAGREP